mmetsp:Transcript_19089/g.35678  ORF Transcript_19089/g.35678 Transcript_19089/m.35678 type:complete len:139 (+) Transcript_19089:1158-1574(+)
MQLVHLSFRIVAAFPSFICLKNIAWLPDIRYRMVRAHPSLAFFNQYTTLAFHGSPSINELPSSSSINSKHAQISSQNSQAEKKHQKISIEANHVVKDSSQKSSLWARRVTMNAKIGMPRYITKATHTVHVQKKVSMKC